MNQTSSSDRVKHEVRQFLGTVYERAYADPDQPLSEELLLVVLIQLENLLRYQGHGAVVEMPIAALEGQRVLTSRPLVLRAGRLGAETVSANCNFAFHAKFFDPSTTPDAACSR